MADYETLKFEIEGHFLADTEMIGVITLNRAAKLNAINPKLVEELGKLLDEIEKNKDIRCLIIRSASEKAFSVGADLTAAAAMMSELDKARDWVADGQRLMRRIGDFPKPIIAELNGLVLGGGLEMAMACDIRIAEKGAKMGNPEVQLGLIAGWGGTQRLAKIVGMGKAKELLLSGRQATAEEALACGLVNKVVEPDDLHAEALFMAQQIADNAPIAVRLTKKLVNMSFDVPIEKGNAEELDDICSTFTTKDLQAGITALFSKAKAKFKDE